MHHETKIGLARELNPGNDYPSCWFVKIAFVYPIHVLNKLTILDCGILAPLDEPGILPRHSPMLLLSWCSNGTNMYLILLEKRRKWVSLFFVKDYCGHNMIFGMVLMIFCEENKEYTRVSSCNEHSMGVNTLIVELKGNKDVFYNNGMQMIHLQQRYLIS